MAGEVHVCQCPLTAQSIKVQIEHYVFHHERIMDDKVLFIEKHREGVKGIAFTTPLVHLFPNTCLTYIRALHKIGDAIVDEISKVVQSQRVASVGVFTVYIEGYEEEFAQKITIKTYIS